MNIDAAYVCELRAMLACDQTDGYLKEWAKNRLEQIEHQTSLVADPKKVSVLIG